MTFAMGGGVSSVIRIFQFFQKNKTISDGGITVDYWIIKVHTSN